MNKKKIQGVTRFFALSNELPTTFLENCKVGQKICQSFENSKNEGKMAIFQELILFFYVSYMSDPMKL